MDNFTENLITAVRERPFLYDMADKDYKNNYIKTVAWADIANEVGGESGDAAKEKWKNLRDTYKKHKKSFHALSRQGKRLRNWVWSQQMEFLDEHLTMRGTESDPLNCTEPSTSTSEITHQLEIGHSRRKRTNSSDKIDYLTSKKVKNQEAATTESLDKTDYLFLSYADTFKRLTPRRQALLKLELAKLFTEAELANLDDAETKREYWE